MKSALPPPACRAPPPLRMDFSVNARPSSAPSTVRLHQHLSTPRPPQHASGLAASKRPAASSSEFSKLYFGEVNHQLGILVQRSSVEIEARIAGAGRASRLPGGPRVRYDSRVRIKPPLELYDPVGQCHATRVPSDLVSASTEELTHSRESLGAFQECRHTPASATTLSQPQPSAAPRTAPDMNCKRHRRRWPS